MEHANSQERYLYYKLSPEYPESAGLRHTFVWLRMLVSSAIQLNRTLVMPRMCLQTQHNLGFSTEHLDWAMFYDVDYEKGTLRLQVPNETGLSEVRIISRKAFEEKEFVEDEVCRVASHQEIPPDAEGKKVVVCEMANMTVDRRRLPKVISKVTTPIRFEPSLQVIMLGDEVIKDLAANGKFIFLHVRRVEKMRELWVFPFYVTLWHIRLFLRAHFAKGSTIYLGTDGAEKDLFNSLRKDYRVLRYDRYPALRELVATRENLKYNNYLLFAVEEYINAHSEYCIETFHSRSVFAHENKEVINTLTLIPKANFAVSKCFQFLMRSRTLYVFRFRFFIRTLAVYSLYFISIGRLLFLLTRCFFRKPFVGSDAPS